MPNDAVAKWAMIGLRSFNALGGLMNDNLTSDPKFALRIYEYTELTAFAG